MQRQGLFRSRTDKVFGGVAGGIARTLNTDPALIRLIFALLVVFGGGGLLLYIILWIAIPEEPIQYFQEQANSGDAASATEDGQQGPGPEPVVFPPSRNNGALIAGLVMIVIGGVFLADRFIPRIHFSDFWPVLIVIAGLALIFSSFAGTKRS